MNQRLFWLFLGVGVIIIAGLTVWLIIRSMTNSQTASNPSPTPTNVTGSPASSTSTPSPTTSSPEAHQGVVLPIAQFFERITIKPFGIYVTPQASPVQPEKFTGYHSGTDIEYTDTTTDVPVYAIAEGTVLQSRTASGYGGVMVIRFTINSQPVVALYGHLRASSMLSVDTNVTAGEKIAVLGTDYSSETDNERRHLHFSIRANNTASLLGYVQAKADLSDWIDPVAYFHSLGF